MDQEYKKFFDLEFLKGDMVFTAQGIKARDLEHAKELVLLFLSDVLDEDSKLIHHEETTIH